jgi:hypothetical protein
MGIRDKIRKHVQPHLEPGETIQAVFAAQTGPSPYFAFLTYLIFFWTKYFVIAVTDKRILVFRSGMWRPSAAKQVTATLPRNTPLGPTSGLWSRLDLGGTRYWVHMRFKKDVEAANAAAPATAIAAG